MDKVMLSLITSRSFEVEEHAHAGGDELIERVGRLNLLAEPGHLGKVVHSR
jgi:hypothetical protein